MAKKTSSKKSSSKKSSKRSSGITSLNYEVQHAIQFDNGNIGFGLYLKDFNITLYNMVIVNGENDSGEYEFISFPQREGSDGKYYKYYYMPLSDKLQKEIIDAVYSELDEDDE